MDSYFITIGTHGAPREVPVLRATVGVEDPREALALVDVMQFHQGLLGLSRKHLLGKVGVAGSGSASWPAKSMAKSATSPL